MIIVAQNHHFVAQNPLFCCPKYFVTNFRCAASSLFSAKGSVSGSGQRPEGLRLNLATSKTGLATFWDQCYQHFSTLTDCPKNLATLWCSLSGSNLQYQIKAMICLPNAEWQVSLNCAFSKCYHWNVSLEAHFIKLIANKHIIKYCKFAIFLILLSVRGKIVYSIGSLILPTLWSSSYH